MKKRDTSSQWVYVKIYAKLTLVIGVLVGGISLLASAMGQFRALAVWSAIIGGLFFIFTVVPTVRDYTGRAGARRSALPWWMAYALLLVCITLGVTFTALGLALTTGARAFLRFYEQAMQGGATVRTLMVVGTALITAVIGTAFFIFRLRQRLIYGATEAVAGITIAAHRMSIEPTTELPTDSGFYLAVLTAGIYLVVRGLDNMHQAIKSGDPLVKRIEAVRVRLLEPERLRKKSTGNQSADSTHPHSSPAKRS